MQPLQKKIDFALIYKVSKANPNGDPLNGNRPRQDFRGRGEITDVCQKRKLRDRLLDRYEQLRERKDGSERGQGVFVQSDERRIDEFKNLRERAEAVLGKEVMGHRDDALKLASETWFDVRAFGQVFAFKSSKAKKVKKGKKGANDGEELSDTDSEQDSGGVSLPIRGPVTIQSAFSVQRVDIESLQISKSTSLEGDGLNRESDQLGMKHRVDFGIYVCFGSINPQLAERTGFSDADAEVIKSLLPKLFENDASSARPDGSMQVLKVFWWMHNCKSGQYSSARVHGSLKVNADGKHDIARLAGLAGLEPEIIDGF